MKIIILIFNICSRFECWFALYYDYVAQSNYETDSNITLLIEKVFNFEPNIAEKTALL